MRSSGTKIPGNTRAQVRISGSAGALTYAVRVPLYASITSLTLFRM